MKILCTLIPLALLSGACAPVKAPDTHIPLAPRSDGPFELGVNVHLDTLPNLARVREMGAIWVRIDVNWESVEPAPGQWDFSAPDKSVRDAESLGLKVYATLAYAPAWARASAHNSGVPDPGAWKNFARQVARHYCGRIQAYGIWNEPNLGEFWSGTAEQYVDILLKPAYATLKAEDPKALVAGPDLAHLYSARLGIQEFFDAMQSLGALHHLDVLSHHVYGADDFPGKLFGFHFGDLIYRPGLIQMLKNSGLESKQVWITEMGADARLGEGVQSQTLLTQLRTLASQPWITKAFIYQLGDDMPPGPQWGLMRPDGSLRPAFYDLRSLIRYEL